MGWPVIHWIWNKEDYFVGQRFQHNPDFDCDVCDEEWLSRFLIEICIHLTKNFLMQQCHTCYDVNMDQDSPFHVIFMFSLLDKFWISYIAKNQETFGGGKELWSDWRRCSVVWLLRHISTDQIVLRTYMSVNFQKKWMSGYVLSSNEKSWPVWYTNLTMWVIWFSRVHHRSQYSYLKN